MKRCRLLEFENIVNLSNSSATINSYLRANSNLKVIFSMRETQSIH